MFAYITVEFHIQANISSTQRVFVTGNLPHLGSWNSKAALELTYTEEDKWVGILKVPTRQIHKTTPPQANTLNFQYKYIVVSEETEHWEDCSNRQISFVLLGCDQIAVNDIWNTGIETLPAIQILPPDNVKLDCSSLLQFGWGSRLFVLAGVPSYYGHEFNRMKIVGNIDLLGNWDVKNGLEMRSLVTVGNNEIIWLARLSVDSQYIQYKYVMESTQNGGVVWESGDNRERKLTEPVQNGVSVYVDGSFKRPEHFNSGWAASGYAGLTNTFAACSMNSVIQMLYHLPMFKQILYKKSGVTPSTGPGMAGPLITLFQKMDTDAFSGNVRSLVERVGLAEDPHEFLILLLFDLKAELQSNEEGPTLVDELFCGKQKITRTRVGDNTVPATEREEEFLGITLQVDGFESLEKSLVHFNLPSSVILAQHEYEQRIELHTLPKVLIVHLNRIMFDSQFVKEIKLCNRFEYPTKFRLTPNNLYKLYAVIVHRGNSSASDGHFYCYVKRNKIWYRFDDENIDIVSKHDATEANFGDILVYLPHDKPPNKV